MKTKILLTPDFDGNQYLENVYNILQDIEDVEVTITKSINLKKLTLGFNAFDFSVVNWLENSMVDNRNRISIASFAKFTVKFLILKIICKKIIYVRHNFYPHALIGTQAILAKNIIDFFVKSADQCLVHSGHLISKNVHYVPHPLYHFDEEIPTNGNEDYYIIFGRIVEYKAIDKLLVAWGEEKLLIAGKVDSIDYLDKLNNIITLRNLNNVTTATHYLSNTEAATKVSSSCGLIIAHSDDDMIVSGSFFFAASLGVPVFAIKTPFFEWLINTQGYVGLFVYDDIRQLINGISSHKKNVKNKNDILNSAQLLFGNDLVKKYWEKEIFKQ